MARILLDAEVLAAHLRGERRFDPGDDDVYVSAITRAELLSARSTDLAPVTRLVNSMQEIVVDKTIADRCGSIRRESGVSLSDALLAATAIEHGLTLITRNIWTFKGIVGLDACAASVR